MLKHVIACLPWPSFAFLTALSTPQQPLPDRLLALPNGGPAQEWSPSCRPMCPLVYVDTFNGNHPG